MTVKGEGRCPSVQAVRATLRQYDYCGLPVGHDGDHRAVIASGQQAGRVVSQWPQSTSCEKRGAFDA